MDFSQDIKAVFFGIAVGDALGVPVEFMDRNTISTNPVKDMVGYGTHHQPAGTWSDDSSLTFCLAEALTKDFSINYIAQNFVAWYKNNLWTARGEVFDIGLSTQQAINRLANGVRPDLAGSTEAYSNGNGSLMRISPLVFYLMDKSISERFLITKQISCITHSHIRSVISCFYYLEFARQLLEKKDKFEIYKDLQSLVQNQLLLLEVKDAETSQFSRLLSGNIFELKNAEISSSGYVIHTLEASIWCLLTTDTFEDSVLKAVNLGNDTDTTAAVTGGLAGLLYGYDNIPVAWKNSLARRDDILDLAQRFQKSLFSLHSF